MNPAARGFLYFLAVLSIAAVSVGSWEWYRNSDNKDSNVVEKKSSNVEEKETLSTLPKAEELAAFEKFEVDFKRNYHNEESRMQHFKIFRDNFKFITEYNAKNKDVTLAVNDFADVHPEVFKSNRMGLKMPTNMEFIKNNNLGTFKATGVEVPKSVDWVKKGGVTPVKNQGQCGSCWSFSTTGALEGRWFTETGKLCSLSEQQFVDCDTLHDHGCNGGLMDYAFKFAESHALCSEESFAYTAKNEKCPANLESKCDVCIPEGGVEGFKDVDSNDVKAMKEALAKGPVSVAIEADQQVFQFYQKGVITSATCGQQLDHGVLAVGYDVYKTDDGEEVPYFKVKNSWGASWGQDGYVYIAQKVSEGGESTCGILAQPSFPVMNKSAASKKVEQPKKFNFKGTKAAQQQTAQEEVFI